MPKSVLTNAQDFRFKDFDLNGVVESWDENIPFKLAEYQYIKRDGAEVEPMGAGPKAFTLRCCLIGSDCGARYRSLAASIQKDPRGQFVHARLGTFYAACRGLRASENPAQAIDCIEFTIEVVENHLDQSTQADQQFGAQRRASQASDALTTVADATNKILSNRIANTVYAAVTAAQVDLTNKVNRFIEVALQVAQTSGDATDLSGYLALEKMLGIVGDKRDAYVLALEATLVKTLETDVSLVDARTAAYISYAACAQLYTAVQAQFPPIVEFAVPTPMPLSMVLLTVYGALGRSRRPQVYQLNRIPLPHWIPAGTVLRMLAPRVN